MKLSSFRWSGLLVAGFFPIHPHANRLSSKTDPLSVPPAINAREVIRTQDSQAMIEWLNPGEIVAGSILAPSTTPSAASECKLGDTQYRINFAGGARKLVIELSGNQDIDLYVRRGSPIALEAGKLLADFRSDSPQTTERLSVPSANYSQLQ